MDWLKELGIFIIAVITNWAAYATGGVLVALAWLWATIKSKPIPKKLGIGMALSFLFLAFFNAWRDQYIQVKGQRNYVRIIAESASYIPKMDFPLFKADQRPYINYGIKVSDGSLVTHAITRAQLEIHNPNPDCPLPKDLSDLGQMSCSPSTPQIEEEVFKRIENKVQLEQGKGPTYVPGERSYSTAYLSHKLSAKETEELRAGSKLMYMVGFTRWEDGAGTHEWRFCTWVIPPSDDALNAEGCLSHEDFLERAEN